MEKKVLISLGIRVSQVIFGIVAIGLGAGVLTEFRGDRINLAVATGVLTLLYGVPQCIPSISKHITLPYVAGINFVLFVLWLTTAAVIGQAFGPLECSDFDYTYYGFSYFYDYSVLVTPCKVAKALIAIAAVGAVMFLVSLGLLAYFSLAKTQKYGTSQLLTGGIFLDISDVPDASGEAGVADDVAATGTGSNEPAGTNDETIGESINKETNVESVNEEANPNNPSVSADESNDIGQEEKVASVSDGAEPNNK